MGHTALFSFSFLSEKSPLWFTSVPCLRYAVALVLFYVRKDNICGSLCITRVARQWDKYRGCPVSVKENVGKIVIENALSCKMIEHFNFARKGSYCSSVIIKHCLRVREGLCVYGAHKSKKSAEVPCSREQRFGFTLVINSCNAE
jgi:hypothetical protein